MHSVLILGRSSSNQRSFLGHSKHSYGTLTAFLWQSYSIRAPWENRQPRPFTPECGSNYCFRQIRHDSCWLELIVMGALTDLCFYFHVFVGIITPHTPPTCLIIQITFNKSICSSSRQNSHSKTYSYVCAMQFKTANTIVLKLGGGGQSHALPLMGQYNILHTNFKYSIWWDDSYIRTYQWSCDFFL